MTAKNLKLIIKAHVDAASSVMTDEGAVAMALSREFVNGGSVNHSIGEHVRGDVYTNIIESYFAIFKRGIMGTYHHLLEHRLKRYLGEFDFRYNTRSKLGIEDAERANRDRATAGVVGKSLTYQQSDRNPI